MAYGKNVHENIVDIGGKIVDMWVRDPIAAPSTAVSAWEFIRSNTIRGFPVFATVFFVSDSSQSQSRPTIETFLVKSFGWDADAEGRKVVASLLLAARREVDWRDFSVSLESVLTLISLGEIPF